MAVRLLEDALGEPLRAQGFGTAPPG
jgi:hypothetical protein